MTKRVEVLENDVHTQAQTIEKLEQKIKEKDLIINELSHYTKELKK
jgi:uncharacterized coiled-coil protein SlyX